jgi:hypothetical protein
MIAIQSVYWRVGRIYRKHSFLYCCVLDRVYRAVPDNALVISVPIYKTICMMKEVLLAKSLTLRKACGLDDIPNECLRHLSRRPLVHLTHLFNHCLRLTHFPKPWTETEVITLRKPGKDKIPLNLRPITLLSKQANYSRKLF